MTEFEAEVGAGLLLDTIPSIGSVRGTAPAITDEYVCGFHYRGLDYTFYELADVVEFVNDLHRIDYIDSKLQAHIDED